MAPPSSALDDIRFVLTEVADLAGLTKLAPFEHADPETVFDLLEENARFMAELIAPLNRVGDTQGSVRNADGTVTTPEGFVSAYKRYVDAGWGGVPFSPDYGGGGFPWLVGVALQELMTTANMAFSMAPLLTQGAIDMLLAHADETQREIYLPKMVSGEWTGSMNLTEPEAGSDVGALRTKAVPADDGSYRISGTKIFITFGEHDMTDNIVHLVLARVPDAPPGTKGISCFIVPKYLVNDDGSIGERNAVTCLSIEHKMGIKASPTCVLEYDGAVGYLIGEPNAGMTYMFTMMNNARLAVGVEGLSIAQRAYEQAVTYAHDRRQGRAIGAPPGEQSPIIEHPDVRRMLLTMRALIEALRALIYLNGEALDIAHHGADADARAAGQELADFLTPLSKAWGTDIGVDVTSLAIQVHGGMGYIEETGVAQHYRDARIAPIYEGTNGIQAIDLVGRKLAMRGGAAVRELIDRIAVIDGELASAGDDLADARVQLSDAVGALREATDWLLARSGEPADALAGATPYLRLFALVVGGWLLTRSALAAQRGLAEGGRDEGEDFFRQKIVTARFYCEQLLPQCRALVPAITATARDLTAAY